MKVFFLVLTLFFCLSLTAQKPTIDTGSYATWPRIRSPKISTDGKFVMYMVFSEKDGRKLVVLAANGSYKAEFAGVKEAIFASNSNDIVFSKLRDSIGILNLQTKALQYLAHVSEFTAPTNDSSQWMIFKVTDTSKSIIAFNLSTGHEKRFSRVQNYLLSNDGHNIVVQFNIIQNNNSNRKIVLADLDSEGLVDILNDADCTNFVFSKTGKKLVFISKSQNNGQNDFAIRYYQPGMDSAIILVNRASAGMKNMDVSPGVLAFSSLEDRIFFRTIELKKDVVAAKPESVSKAKVHLYNYQDEVFQFKEADETFFSVKHLNGPDSVIRLYSFKNDNGYKSEDRDNKYLLSQTNYWDWVQPVFDGLPQLNLISTTDGCRTLLAKNFQGFIYGFSPSGKYALWYDKAKKQWVAYNVLLKQAKFITRSIPFDLSENSDLPESPRSPQPVGIVGWLEGDSSLFIYDRYDIWMVDPDGIKTPVNITKGYGRRNRIQFRCVNFNSIKLPSIRLKDTLILSALSLHSKDNGFFSLSLRQGSLRKLVMKPRAYYFSSGDDNFVLSGSDGLIPPIKAKTANIYLLSYMSAKDYPNLYLTSDFIDFKQVSDLSPQKHYNWYSTELVLWKSHDGLPMEGILYKPEDFDSTNKYPIIVYYYERHANGLNFFLNPELSSGIINIPTFVSNGYLVFVPDIYYEVGHPGKSALNAVVSAVEHLSAKSWVDVHKIGLQGYSFGGFETNYIVSHSTLFRAAVAGAGATNLISKYNQFFSLSRSQIYYEYGQGRIGATLWDRPDLYIENSSILQAKQVGTPLLILQNENDMSVYFNQGAEWFNCLQRLKKKVWMVSYEEGHSIDDPNNQLDCSIRLTQFFDHYLKDKPAPKWMTERGTSLELDTTGKQR